MSRGEYLPTHFKNMREVAAALNGMKLQKAFHYLGDVKEHKQVIPFRRFAGGIGRASQAKQFGTTKGEAEARRRQGLSESEGYFPGRGMGCRQNTMILEV